MYPNTVSCGDCDWHGPSEEWEGHECTWEDNR